MSSRFLIGLDIGTATAKLVVAEDRENRLVPRLFLKEPVAGVRKGAIVDLAELTPIVARLLSEARKFSRSAAKNLYVSIGTPQVKSQKSRGIVAVSRADNEIYQDDIDRVMKASEAINLGPNRTIIHTVIQEYIVDGVPDIQDPLGLSGSRLEVSSLILDAFQPHIKSIIRAVEIAGGEPAGLVFSPLSASASVLSKRQKELGVALVDIGSGTTGLAVYEESKLVGAAKFPVGSGHISGDLAIGLKIPLTVAEAIKLHYGYAVSSEVGTKETIDLKKFYPEAKGSVSRRFVADIIESRMTEILELVSSEIRALGKAGQLVGGVVLVGGGAKLPGVVDLAESTLKLTTQIGVPIGEDWQMESVNFTESFEDPEYASALGLILNSLEQQGARRPRGKLSFSWRNWLKYFLP